MDYGIRTLKKVKKMKEYAEMIEDCLEESIEDDDEDYEEDNDFRRLTQLNPYFVPVAGEVKMEAEFHQIDAKVGYRMTGMNGFNADISGGFDMSENQADMVVLSQSKKSLALPMVEFRKSRCFYVNADFSYAYKDVLRIDAKNRLNIESNKHDGEWVKGSYVRPAFGR